MAPAVVAMSSGTGRPVSTRIMHKQSAEYQSTALVCGWSGRAVKLQFQLISDYLL